jgi:hypothetical protein
VTLPACRQHYNFYFKSYFFSFVELVMRKASVRRIGEKVVL